MKRLLSTLSCVPVALTAMVILAPSASAEERQCRGAIGAVTLDNVHVPDGATCTLNGTSLKGSLTIGRGATLTAKSVKVIGNIQSEGHRLVRVYDSRVGGSIQLEQGGGLDVRRNVVNGDVQVLSNTRGTKTITRNRIDGNLQCKANNPAPVGGGNMVGGNKEDQCRLL